MVAQRDKLERLRNLTVLALPPAASAGLGALARRSMRLQCNIQEGQVSMTDGADVVVIEPVTLRRPGQAQGEAR